MCKISAQFDRFSEELSDKRADGHTDRFESELTF